MTNVLNKKKKNKCMKCGILHNGYWRMPITPYYLCYKCYRKNVGKLQKVYRALIKAEEDTIKVLGKNWRNQK